MGDVRGFLKVKRQAARYRLVCERIKDYWEVMSLRSDEGRFKLLTQHFTEFFMRCIKTKCFPRSIV